MIPAEGTSNAPFPERALEVPPVGPWKRRKPEVTYFLIVFNTLIYLLMTVAGGSTNVRTLLDFGAMYHPLVAAGDYWRLLTPIFLHIGLLHLVFNMYALLVLGNVVEQLYGSARFFFLYLISGIGGTIGSYLFSTSISAGASGAIFGVSGISLIAGYRYRDRIPANFKSIVGRGIVPFVVYNLAYGLLNKGIDNFAHLGGLITGAALAFLVQPLNPAVPRKQQGILSYSSLLPLALILGAFAFPVKAHFEMKRVEADFRRGLTLEKEKRYGESIEAYQRAMRIRPDLPSIHNNLAIIYTRQQKFDEAEREARQAVRLGENEAMYHQTLGAVLWHKQRFQGAVEQYNRAIELDPKNAELHQALATLYEEQGSLDKATREWEKVKALRPGEVSVDQHLEVLRDRMATTRGPQSK